MFSYNTALHFANRKILAHFLICLWPLAIHVNSANANENSAEEIARINEEVAVLSAKLAETEMQTKIAAKRLELEKLNAPSPISDEVLPVVRSIEGADGRLIATLITPTGALQSVVKGDRVGKWKVSAIKFNAVSLSRGKKNIQLAFGNVAPVLPPAAPATLPVAAPMIVPPAR